jgi:soluble lytic murein transglycosylase-like protein
MRRRQATLASLAFALASTSFGPAGGPGAPAAHAPPGRPAESRLAGDPQVAAVAAQLAARPTALDAPEIERVAAAIVEEADLRGFAPGLVLALIEVESGFDSFAVSHKGAMGLMQVLPVTGRPLARELGIEWRGPRTLFDPVANVRIGLAYLESLCERFGHLPTALAAYNEGPSAVGRRVRSGEPVPASYAERVLSTYAERAEVPIHSS